MSGGVDSAIAAWKLKASGYDVLGIHFRFWKWRGTDSQYQEEMNKLGRLTERIGIPLVDLDMRESFRERVVEQMAESLGRGLTPNPCIHCNPKLKFDQLIHYAEQARIEWVATGHYAVLEKGDENKVRLFKARDKSKDQSYFLCLLTQNILGRCIFPLGSTLKKENIALAEELGLAFEDKPESQDLCFLTNETYAEFIRAEWPEIMRPGEIRDTSGKVLGAHLGLPNYTIGQRKGIEIPAGKPYYVICKDVKNNVLIVGSSEELRFGSMSVSGVNWISGEVIDHISCEVKIRYRSPEYPCQLSRVAESKYHVRFFEDIRDITPGQYAVFYLGEEMLGGGMISSVDGDYG